MHVYLICFAWLHRPISANLSNNLLEGPEVLIPVAPKLANGHEPELVTYALQLHDPPP
jgi:hypothetical protein